MKQVIVDINTSDFSKGEVLGYVASFEEAEILGSDMLDKPAVTIYETAAAYYIID